MKKKDLIDLKNKTEKELMSKADEARHSLVNTRLEMKLGRVKNVHEVKSKRKDLAQIMTYLKLKGMNSVADKTKVVKEGKK